MENFLLWKFVTKIPAVQSRFRDRSIVDVKVRAEGFVSRRRLIDTSPRPTAGQFQLRTLFKSEVRRTSANNYSIRFLTNRVGRGIDATRRPEEHRVETTSEHDAAVGFHLQSAIEIVEKRGTTSEITREIESWTPNGVLDYRAEQSVVYQFGIFLIGFVVLRRWRNASEIDCPQRVSQFTLVTVSLVFVSMTQGTRFFRPEKTLFEFGNFVEEVGGGASRRSGRNFNNFANVTKW